MGDSHSLPPKGGSHRRKAEATEDASSQIPASAGRAPQTARIGPMVETRAGDRALIGALVAVCVSCGGGGSSGPPTTPTPNPYTITISGSGIVSPKDLTVPPGSRVLFVNAHNRRH